MIKIEITVSRFVNALTLMASDVDLLIVLLCHFNRAYRATLCESKADEALSR